ncbi:hypothetical protein PGIN_3A1_00257 [Porphyromonas gingivalis]|nr:hypothetical protein PGIN_3A1_00257 [Porphyromonas gingivalis]
MLLYLDRNICIYYNKDLFPHQSIALDTRKHKGTISCSYFAVNVEISFPNFIAFTVKSMSGCAEIIGDNAV